ncbi:MAG: adenylate/guanylate cyclase domain-containing protein [Aquimonas sp.]|nr:adenylate/guanylate cyclase domain-containing protein [Aquimonas sp.]
MSVSQPISILFADVSGSTRLFEQRGDVEARRIISGVLDALLVIVASHGGRLVKTIGDEIMCTFPAALQAALAACDMQRRVSADPVFVADSLGIRVGFHHGEALLENGDVYGDAVNVAARMAGLAKREQIVTTASSFAGLSHAANLRSRPLGRARVAGKLLPLEIIDLIWQEDTSNLTLIQRAVRLEDAAPAGCALVLRHRGRVLELGEDSAPLSMGRDASCGVSIEAEWVSRNHASLECRRGLWVFTDRSTNGSFVRFGEEPELRVHRNELPLRQSGCISLGQSTSVGGADLLRFEVR